VSLCVCVCVLSTHCRVCGSALIVCTRSVVVVVVVVVVCGCGAASVPQDKPDAEGDLDLARHITYVHQHGRHPELDFEPMDPSFIRAYISEARAKAPVIPSSVSSELVEVRSLREPVVCEAACVPLWLLPAVAAASGAVVFWCAQVRRLTLALVLFCFGHTVRDQSYVNMRANEAKEAAAANEQAVMTARRLLSILRLSQGLARLRFADEVAAEDVKEAIRLVHMSSVRATGLVLMHGGWNCVIMWSFVTHLPALHPVLSCVAGFAD